MAELADALDLGSSVLYMGVQVPSSAPNKKIINNIHSNSGWIFNLNKTIKITLNEAP